MGYVTANAAISSYTPINILSMFSKVATRLLRHVCCVIHEPPVRLDFFIQGLPMGIKASGVALLKK